MLLRIKLIPKHNCYMFLCSLYSPPLLTSEDNSRLHLSSEACVCITQRAAASLSWISISLLGAGVCLCQWPWVQDKGTICCVRGHPESAHGGEGGRWDEITQVRTCWIWGKRGEAFRRRFLYVKHVCQDKACVQYVRNKTWWDML